MKPIGRQNISLYRITALIVMNDEALCCLPLLQASKIKLVVSSQLLYTDIRSFFAALTIMEPQPLYQSPKNQCSTK